MKRTAHALLGALYMITLLIPVCFAQSDTNLADAARTTRKDKAQATPAKVFDNDSLPKSEHISVVGTAAVAPASLQSDTTEQAQKSDTSADDNDAANKKDDKTRLTVDPDSSAGDREKTYGEWRKKIADQKDTITLLQRELDVLQREYRLRAAAMYADVGYRLRNQSDWDKQDRDYKDKIEAKQKELDRARQQLSDLQDQARKGGVPAAVVE
jgi:hypothetical protein